MSTQPHPTCTRPAMNGSNAIAVKIGRKKISLECLVNERGPFVRMVESNLDSPRRNTILFPMDQMRAMATMLNILADTHDLANPNAKLLDASPTYEFFKTSS